MGFFDKIEDVTIVDNGALWQLYICHSSAEELYRRQCRVQKVVIE